MRILVISDTHGRTELVEKIYSKMKDVDLIVHLGDFLRDGEMLKSRLGVDVVAVKGNMDGEYSSLGYRILETEYGKLYLTHGHMESVKFGTEGLLKKAKEQGCKGALFGHTHIPYYEEVEGVYLVNPGSLAYPRGRRSGSYAVINTSRDSFQGGIVYLDQMLEDQKELGRRRAGGYLRTLLNNSDRF